MLKIPTGLNLIKVLAATVDLRYTVDGTGVQMANRQSGGPIPNAVLAEAAAEIASARRQDVLHVMVNRLPSGISVPRHRDFLEPTEALGRHPCLERWHLPLTTSENATYGDELGNELHMARGFWWGPVPYWLEHWIKNSGRPDRVHLVVDLDTKVPAGRYVT
jgi:hypothetical protein